MKNITVIIPSYNRAHLLHLTIPTYLQEKVLELILVDDCSSDNTPDVVAELQKQYPQIRYVRNPENRKQAYSKNIALEMARGEYVYFGDDDSILLPYSLHCLHETLIKFNGGGSMARALVAGPNFRWEKRDKYIRWRITRNKACFSTDVFDVASLTFKWGMWLDKIIQVPTCPACALVKTELARMCKFDPNYLGCAYREETDFFFRLNLDYGASLYFDSRACQLNLPNYMVKQTGARSGGYSVWRKSAIECNLYFLKKNWPKIAYHYGIEKSIEQMQKEFENSLPLEEPNVSRMKCWLKNIYFSLFVYT